MDEKFLTIGEVGRYLNLSEDEVKELVEKGDLPAYRVGGVLLRFKRNQVEDYHKRRDSAIMRDESLLQDRGVKSNFTPVNADRRHLWIDRKNASEPINVTSYTFWERLEDFLYYNDFYILSLILLVLILVAVFGF